MEFSGFSIFVGFVLTIVGMVLLYVKVIPQKFDGSFSNKFLQSVHDYFNFKKLYLESVLKFLFTLLTVLCIVAGIVSILSAFLNVFDGIGSAIRYGYSLGYVIVPFFGGILVVF